MCKYPLFAYVYLFSQTSLVHTPNFRQMQTYVTFANLCLFLFPLSPSPRDDTLQETCSVTYPINYLRNTSDHSYYCISKFSYFPPTIIKPKPYISQDRVKSLSNVIKTELVFTRLACAVGENRCCKVDCLYTSNVACGVELLT